MKAVIQRVKKASCSVDGTVTSSISSGLLIYFGVDKGDDEKSIPRFIDKILKLRCFRDENDKMNLSVLDTGGGVLIISQFTLASDIYHGNRPSFDSAESPDKAREIYEKAVEYIRGKGIETGTGVFGAHMEISYINDGPVTFVLDSEKFFRKS